MILSVSLSDTPQAKAIYDSSNFGIYKGVFVGSTGTVLVNINNEGELTAKRTIKGSSSFYTSAESVTEDLPIEGLTFSNGSSSFDFSVSAVGGNASVSSINIIGHPNASIEIIKELSDDLVKCYVGGFGGDDSGTFNLIIQGNAIYGLAKSNGDDSSFSLGGVKSGASISGSFEGGGFSGSENGNNISGTWENSLLESGTWSGTRKL